MPGARLLRILTRLHDAESVRLLPARLCEVCAEVMAMTGAGITLMSGDVARGSICSSNAVSALLEDLQFTLGEGPCIDAYTQDQVVSEPDLAGAGGHRWVAFGPPAVAAGAVAVFGFPMRVGAVRVGALNVYRDRSGPLNDEQYADGMVLAGVAARAVLGMQAHAPPGTLGTELEVGADFRLVVHQAAGMVSVQLEITVGEALIRLRAHAFAYDRPLAMVAEDIVARRLRFN
jgi:hypothetical protein